MVSLREQAGVFSGGDDSFTFPVFHDKVVFLIQGDFTSDGIGGDNTTGVDEGEQREGGDDGELHQGRRLVF